MYIKGVLEKVWSFHHYLDFLFILKDRMDSNNFLKCFSRRQVPSLTFVFMLCFFFPFVFSQNGILGYSHFFRVYYFHRLKDWEQCLFYIYIYMIKANLYYFMYVSSLLNTHFWKHISLNTVHYWHFYGGCWLYMHMNYLGFYCLLIWTIFVFILLPLALFIKLIICCKIQSCDNFGMLSKSILFWQLRFLVTENF